MQNLGKIVPVIPNLVFMVESPTRQGSAQNDKIVHKMSGSCLINIYYKTKKVYDIILRYGRTSRL